MGAVVPEAPHASPASVQSVRRRTASVPAQPLEQSQTSFTLSRTINAAQTNVHETASADHGTVQAQCAKRIHPSTVVAQSVERLSFKQMVVRSKLAHGTVVTRGCAVPFCPLVTRAQP